MADRGPAFVSDSPARDLIADWLHDPDWGAGMLDIIADTLAAIGRDIADKARKPTWDRH
jgi:hypothetical protein